MRQLGRRGRSLQRLEVHGVVQIDRDRNAALQQRRVPVADRTLDDDRIHLAEQRLQQVLRHGCRRARQVSAGFDAVRRDHGVDPWHERPRELDAADRRPGHGRSEVVRAEDQHQRPRALLAVREQVADRAALGSRGPSEDRSDLGEELLVAQHAATLDRVPLDGKLRVGAMLVRPRTARSDERDGAREGLRLEHLAEHAKRRPLRARLAHVRGPAVERRAVHVTALHDPRRLARQDAVPGEPEPPAPVDVPEIGLELRTRSSGRRERRPARGECSSVEEQGGALPHRDGRGEEAPGVALATREHVEARTVERDRDAAGIEDAWSDRHGIARPQLPRKRERGAEARERRDLEEHDELLVDRIDHVTDDGRPPGTAREGDVPGGVARIDPVRGRHGQHADREVAVLGRELRGHLEVGRTAAVEEHQAHVARSSIGVVDDA